MIEKKSCKDMTDSELMKELGISKEQLHEWTKDFTEQFLKTILIIKASQKEDP